MTYRRWKQEYTRLREEATPDVAPRLPIESATPTPRPVTWYRVVAAVAAAVVLCASIVGVREWMLPTGQTDTPMGGGSLMLTAHIGVRAVPLLHTDTAAEAFQSPCTYVGVRTVHLSNPVAVEGHGSCVGVFYNFAEQTYFCTEHIVRDALTRNGISHAGVVVYFHYYHPTLQRVLFTVSSGSHPSYCYDIASDTLQKLSVSLRHCPGETAMGTSPYVVLPRLGGERDELFLVDLRTAEVKSVLKNARGEYIYAPMDDGHLSHDGNYVLFTLSEGDAETVNGPGRTTVAYEIATGESRTFIGYICDEIADSSRLLLETPDGFAVHDLTSGTTVPFAEADLPEQYRWYLRHTDSVSSASSIGYYRLNVRDRLSDDRTLLCEEFVDAYVMSADRRYLYYYIRGEEYIRVRDMATGADEMLALDAAFWQETETGENGTRAIEFDMWLDESINVLVINYRVSELMREDPEEILKEREKYPYYPYLSLTYGDTLTSLSSLESVLSRFASYVTAYEGDGYIYLDVTGLYTDERGQLSGETHVLLEYYTVGEFHRLRHRGSITASFDGDDPLTLPADAEQQTRAMLERLGIPLLPSEKDYPHYFENGDIFRQLELISGDQARDWIASYCVRKQGGYIGARMALESGEDLQELWDFLLFTDGLTYERVLRDRGDEDVPIWMGCRYAIHLNMGYGVNDTPIIRLGEYNGQPILIKNGCLAYITDADLQKWSAWADRQEKKGHLD